MTSADKTIGVLGGMGPKATADLLGKLIDATPAASEQEHLRILIDCNPKVPDRNDAIAGTGASPADTLAGMAAGLERAGADFLVMACNTAHAFAGDIQAAIHVPFVSMIDEACDACLRHWPDARRIGILGAPGCMAAGLYQTGLRQRGLVPLCLDPASQALFGTLLYDIKLGRPLAGTGPRMVALARALERDGAQVLIAACTEVPLVLSQRDLRIPLLDATQNLAERCVSYARGLAPLPTTS